MKFNFSELKEKLTAAGLKITPQRIAVIEAILNLDNHPNADNIIEYIRKTHPNIASGTVYKVLDTLIKNNIARKVNTEKDIMRYEVIMENHHHLYCMESDRIEDYFDEELDELIREHFAKNNIKDFSIENIKLEIQGKFSKSH